MDDKKLVSKNSKIPWLPAGAVIYAILGLFIAISPWLPFRYVEAQSITQNFSGLQTAGNFALALTVVGGGAFFVGISFLVKKPAPRYVPILFSITALVLSAFFCLLVRQETPTVDQQRLVLIFNESLWKEVRHLQTGSGWGNGLFAAALCSVFMCLLTPILAKTKQTESH